MNDGHEALHAGENVEEHLHARDDGKHVAPHPDHVLLMSEGAAAADQGRTDANHLHGHHVVGEDVDGIHRFAAPQLPPALETKAEDGDGEREEEEDVGDGEAGEDGGAGGGAEAAAVGGVVGGVGGHILGGRGVDVHVHGPKEEEEGGTKRTRERGEVT